MRIIMSQTLIGRAIVLACELPATMCKRDHSIACKEALSHSRKADHQRHQSSETPQRNCKPTTLSWRGQRNGGAELPSVVSGLWGGTIGVGLRLWLHTRNQTLA